MSLPFFDYPSARRGATSSPNHRLVAGRVANVITQGALDLLLLVLALVLFLLLVMFLLVLVLALVLLALLLLLLPLLPLLPLPLLLQMLMLSVRHTHTASARPSPPIIRVLLVFHPPHPSPHHPILPLLRLPPLRLAVTVQGAASGVLAAAGQNIAGCRVRQCLRTLLSLPTCLSHCPVLAVRAPRRWGLGCDDRHAVLCQPPPAQIALLARWWRRYGRAELLTAGRG